MIAIIDYGMGNLRSVQKAFQKLGYQAFITSDPLEILDADKLVLPGVGAFADAMASLKEKELDRAIVEFIGSGRPFLGICLGLQLLFEESGEGGRHPGLGLVEGDVRRLPQGVKVPHMGWSRTWFVRDDPILKEIPSGSFFYYVHSYYAQPKDERMAICTADYGLEFVSGINKENLYAFQFHPEKSSSYGLKILRNFGEM
ncbi:imidazole glycerol-phosphate synthase subunit HisH [Candidatus Hakubella thermalkaliphila]|uniref:Imidazole glycerol phosphate synthase subunit HisH n=1 Tax=Candidatus Hakubella thermalkaliphila TaxID=2754717 RepID=A0A6V8Q945_9ACTN|nr:imidazole glycerol phosphate synthase subunit HisH [Candidatus Hakubella thermalkaliphila]GFP18924.1 imidazole glycerol-phosphate synthase subunit HisH [Candidatus Hakubella thermalkaliphila]GFP29938.1 imidazole glycerol-phosphate synthase subunit HisH [Candidatus Hakubella thermalkaliphila]GFP38897.1 imidazole glycerol-phosphate synthase subunit HisH [Candidatus Hakubella thermalkaliphila]GFP40900.1 imidazole glycerol-phosphate synthase subunit HisH [Candidatus Hakubella thermalkaliphila]